MRLPAFATHALRPPARSTSAVIRRARPPARTWARTLGTVLALVALPARSATPGSEPPPARADATACLVQPAGQNERWDAACLRQRYASTPAHWPAPRIDAGVRWTEMAPPPPAAASPGPVADLGRQLFFDPRLSRKGQIACASCHQPARAFSDGRPLAIGEDGLQGRRRSMPLLAAPFAPSLFWDGRAATLEAQVLMPLQDPREMNHALGDALARLAALPEYAVPAAQAFGDARIDATRLSAALAAYVRTLRPAPSAYDRAVAGDLSAYSDTELTGLHLFRTKARCMNCHHGALLTDHGFHDLGLSFYRRRNQDLGRYEATRNPADAGQFRTPSLRNVSAAGPWMHNGLFPSLDGLMRLYNAGMGNVSGPADDPLLPRKSPLIQPLKLSADEIAALAAFLKTL